MEQFGWRRVNPAMTGVTDHESGISQKLAKFAADLDGGQIPESVIDRITELFIDWTGSCLSGGNQRAIKSMIKFAEDMGPTSGHSEILVSGNKTSPYFAALVNAASSHISEQDDLHNGSVLHPATVVFPPALAVAQHLGCSGAAFLTACVAGYEVGIRVGEYLGRSHYEVFHTTGTAGAFAAAAATGHLLKLNSNEMNNAFGSAGTQSAGLWEFLRDASDSKQLHTAKASTNGLTAAFLAKDGFSGASRILEGRQGIAAGMSHDADDNKAIDRLGTRWTVDETSLKFHASCRHTHPACDAMLEVVSQQGLNINEIESVTAHVHQAAIDVLGMVHTPETVHQAKFSMGASLGLIAAHREAGLLQYEQVLTDKPVMDFVDRVKMVLDPEINAAYPQRWIGKVTVTTKNKDTFVNEVHQPKGDPGNRLSTQEIEQKFLRLVDYSGTLTSSSANHLLERLWNTKHCSRMDWFHGQ